MKKEKCLNCGYEFNLSEVYNDDLGLFTVCPKCDGSFDIDIMDYPVADGTKVLLSDDKSEVK